MNNKKTTSNITVKIKKNSLPNFMQSNRSNKPKESFLALEEYKKHCVKINSNTNSNFSNQIRGESLKLYLMESQKYLIIFDVLYLDESH